jgi:hypothetical protein
MRHKAQARNPSSRLNGVAQWIPGSMLRIAPE